jgi:hypothetical protein
MRLKPIPNRQRSFGGRLIHSDIATSRRCPADARFLGRIRPDGEAGDSGGEIGLIRKRKCQKSIQLFVAPPLPVSSSLRE